ncbi:MAG: sulfate ABC transporter substrate-binding protein [Acidobacteria bacterium]|nr:MAG: sulfate ABC transporter substrate-binding protein [Acidobacteriota bacterium]
MEGQVIGVKMRKSLVSLALFAALICSSCLPSAPNSGGNGQTITVYGFSIMKEALEKEIYPAFAAKWKREHGVDVNFVSSFAGSETVTNQILQGAPADLAILSIDRDAQRLMQGKATTTDWHAFPNQGIVNRTPFVILVRKGNPKQILDFPDLAKPGVKVIHPDPVSSGGAQWSILSIYGSELKKSEVESGEQDKTRALHTLQAIWKNVIATPGSAREARTNFETGYGDALVTYELEGLMMKQAGAEVDVIVPKATIFSEHPAVIIDRNVTAAERPAVQAFVNFLWSDEAQQAFVKYYFRSVTNDSFNDSNSQLAKIELPFTVEMFGGWDRAYPEVIEQIFRDQVQSK